MFNIETKNDAIVDCEYDVTTLVYRFPKVL